MRQLVQDLIQLRQSTIPPLAPLDSYHHHSGPLHWLAHTRAFDKWIGSHRSALYCGLRDLAGSSNFSFFAELRKILHLKSSQVVPSPSESVASATGPGQSRHLLSSMQRSELIYCGLPLQQPDIGLRSVPPSLRVVDAILWRFTAQLLAPILEDKKQCDVLLKDIVPELAHVTSGAEAHRIFHTLQNVIKASKKHKRLSAIAVVDGADHLTIDELNEVRLKTLELGAISKIVFSARYTHPPDIHTKFGIFSVEEATEYNGMYNTKGLRSMRRLTVHRMFGVFVL